MTNTASASLRPGDRGHDDELVGFQLGFAQRPALTAPARSTVDVVAAVRHAAARGMPVGVEATGHGLPGGYEGGLLVTTRHMDRLTVDPAARTVRVRAGVRRGQVFAAAEPYGPAPLGAPPTL
jgi:FAD/FMN-containing dehydrogenase